MEAYSGFAELYDILMDDVPYDEWTVFITDRLREKGISDGLVLDIGCGSGIMTESLADRGYDMIGVDISSEMLENAQEKARAGGRDILYLQQDMCELELYGTVRAVVSVCDSLNYLLHEEDLIETFRRVNNYLDPGGIFLFDFNTDQKYRWTLGDQTIAENRNEGSFIWENFYDEEERVNQCQLTLFVRDKKDSDCYKKYVEFHEQRGYTLEEIRAALQKAGLRFVQAYDDYSSCAPDRMSERICVMAEEQGKDGR